MTPALPTLLALWMVDPAATPAPTTATSPAERFEQGRALFDQGRYAEAADVFVRLHAETGEANVLYAAGHSFRRGGKCQDALAAYEAFVAAAPAVQPGAGNAPADSHAHPAVTDLDNARARIIEMRICAGRVRSRAGRDEAGRLANHDRAAALAILEDHWRQTSDPTILPPLVRLQQRMGACARATARLDAALDALGPIETLDEAALPDSDVAAARETLSELRRIKSDERCAPVAVAAPPRDEPTTNVTLPAPPGSAEPARARWTMAGAAVLLAAGGVSGALMYHTQGELDAYGKEKRPWDGRGAELLEDGQRYQLGAVLLTATAVVVGTAAILYSAFGGAGATGKRSKADRIAIFGSLGAL